ncbi:hypothetical protein FNV62_36435 [Streptomyces sp. RLB3-17]|uniref:hypothetical protein n=1 Tax=Streptomyces sp. RLB3-17 TaxID=2594455 RepID=UPI0011629ADF|nr:hypothetical protein [Streptomyces sp. RLB3-17]QDO42899.1 hypothetical protein FNV62_36435 [Streptomyces sp. RLB3-17]
MASLNKDTSADEPWWAGAQAAEPTPVGCCSLCPVAAGCPLRADSAVRCAVTGEQPPPAPPVIAPGLAEAVSQDLAVAVAEAVNWADVTATAAERAPSRDDGNDVDWGRLQPVRNLLSIAVVSFAPFGHTTAALWVADTISRGGITAPVFIPLGAVLAGTGAVLLGRIAPGLLGVVCELAWKSLTLTSRGLWRLVRSPRGWIITRPALWAAGIGVLIVSWRAVTHFLTGA